VQKKLIKFACIVLAFSICACSPKFNWREVRGVDAPYSILLPAKPASFSREMQLGGVTLQMHMTAADAGGVSFAVGCAKVEDASKIPAILAAMKTGMINNIHGTAATEGQQSDSDIVVSGTLENGQAVKLTGRFVARGAWVYQVIVLGPEKALTPEVVDTFMTSFKIN
jgi:hypothetical protein